MQQSHVKLSIFLLFLLSFTVCKSQSTYVVDYTGSIYSVDMAAACKTKFIYRCDHGGIVDIAADAAGNIYTSNGDSLFKLDPANTSAGCIYLGKFANSINGLLVSGDGNVYASGDGLSMYDPVSGNFSLVGIFPGNIYSAGDMVEYKGKIYMSANDGTIYEINKDDPYLSTPYYPIGSADIFGMAIVSTSCYGSPVPQQRLLAFAQTANGAQTYLVDMENKTSFPSFCSLAIGVTGATSVNASTVTAGPIGIASVSFVPPACNQYADGKIELIMSASAINNYTFSIDNQPTSVYSVFDSLGPGLHTVRIKNQFGCFKDTVVHIPASNVDCRDTVFIPTAFTPDGNGLNDILRARCGLPVKNFELNIYNRYGQRIYTSEDIGHGWDGTFGSKQQPAGVYVWFMHYRSFAGKDVSRKGIITLIR